MNVKCVCFCLAGFLMSSCICDAGPGGLMRDRVVWMRDASLEGMFWISPGLTCREGPRSDSILIDTSNMSAVHLRHIGTALSDHNSKLSKDVVDAECGG
jgi:hypothetical protein